jgi:putative acetyltransferase
VPPIGSADVLIRPESASDVDAIRHVTEAAFGSSVEADLVDALRREASPVLSLVADDAGAVVGHVMFSPVSIEGSASETSFLVGLAPLSVQPDRQRAGIGGALIREGLSACRVRGIVATVLVGMPAYYSRFGFAPASRFGLSCEYDVPDDVFMAIELEPGALARRRGLVRYHPAFARTGA